ncbi:protein indeterminate-domain 12-like [Bidens hawaiensis]|uniref:protein indeterminate-domain 12-like n=1 Tax=Bidens hawaiensis TaxID=980011 RepID=UPI004049333C
MKQQNVILEDDLSNSASDLHATTENISQDENGSNYHQNYFAAAHPPPSQSQPLTKKKRNLPGNPDPEAEVISLSPTTLMATNRFVCEMCNKGFQRDQNLQLHRRGHNLPWKLKQRNKNEVVRKKVYVCPEVNCVHHEPSRALGDLTGIKKHFSRKHGEKKWKCEKCSKKYAVQSDWKAHSKTCGTREYKCDCGTLFSRRDSFITHRAFCDALAQESARSITELDPTTIPGQLYPVHTSNSLLLFPPSWLQSQYQEYCSPSSNITTSCGPHMISYHPTLPYMSATAMLQKAAEMGTTHLSSSRGTSLQAPCTSTTTSLAAGPHHQHQPYIPHVSANSPAAGNNTCGTSSSLLEACADGGPTPHNTSFIHPVNMNMMTMLMMTEDGFADVSSFDDAFSQILDANATKKEEDGVDDNNINNNNMMMMNMTRDFLGLKDDDDDDDDDIGSIHESINI